MANYQRNEAINRVLRAKQAWESANAQGLEAEKNTAAKKAAAVYAEMEQNGDRVLAQNLQQRDYAQAQDYTKEYIARAGNVPIRQYLYGQGKQKGLTESDIDSMLSYVPQTGEVIFNGKNLGTPDGLVDGVSYFAPQRLQGLISDSIADTDVYSRYLTMTDKSRDMITEQRAALQEDYDSFNKKYEELLEKEKQGATADADYRNVYNAIMDQYNLQGAKEANNIIAQRAAQNGGYMDSYGAAASLSKQLAVLTEGNKAAVEGAISVYNEKIDGLRQTLAALEKSTSDIRTKQQNLIDKTRTATQALFDNYQTEKNYDTVRNAQIASVTGYVPAAWSRQNNPYFNDDGTLLDVETDYKAIIDHARNALKNETDEAEKKRLNEKINYANDARNYKIRNFAQYAKWAADTEPVMPQSTFARQQAESEMNLAKDQLASAERISASSGQNTLKEAQLKAQAQVDAAKIQASSKIAAAESAAQSKVEAEKIKTEVERAVQKKREEAWEEQEKKRKETE